MNNILWYVEKYTTNLNNQQLVADQMLSEILTEFYYEELTVFRKRILNIGTWTNEIRIESEKFMTSWVFAGFTEDL